MQIIRQLNALKTAIADVKSDGGTVALVPTMGALHAGHMQLVHEAAKRADHVVASIFVNPTQFGEGEDLDAYPRQEEADARLLREAGVKILWAPDAEEMYPHGYSTTISVSGVSMGLCGGTRPGHFDGVATVVSKLFHQVEPDMALFGEKDYQQLAVIRRFVRDLDFTLEIVGVPTVRDHDGLALSSRNAYLSAENRAAAAHFPKALREGIARLEQGADVTATLDGIEQQILAAGFKSVDYVSLCDAGNLQELATLDRPARLLSAARIGSTRLIDNMAVTPTTT
ncbi:pantoate--beta-alanine ligase [Sphingorhabdus sp. Alg239-R122]|uniref:pantoate--beta-alanine ligase n=1 Tax=Sphingorhabdus sp. Alg239-R122 TaxID=2305989 RepID=UPI0013DAD74A|nr:pantoate--beta-alanine ligase [Sphingorhabdus sp. Alg239-R122]